MRYDGPPGPGPSDPHEPPGPEPAGLHEPPGPEPAGPSSPAAGRHRRGGPVRRRALRRPGFAASVLAAGTAATAATVLLGLYAAHPPTASAPRATRPPAAEAPPPSHPTRAPAPPPARAG
ncbi:hypothetical protein ACFWFX_29355, partial [Streptomyces roseolus]